MTRMSQLALPLVGGDDEDSSLRIIISQANEAVAKALSEPGAWPFRTAVLCGPPRSGKTLLGRWFAHTQPFAQVIDGVDAWEEAEVFHAWNRAQESGAPLLLISDTADWVVSLPDLRSRLSAALHLAISEPDDALLSALLELHAARRRLVLGDSAATYLVPRIERSYAAAERIVAEIDRISLERKVPPARSIWRDALEAGQGPSQTRLL
jgi:chromosomal replication initiation ATPase DnaA